MSQYNFFMTHETSRNQIAILATGDEITNGDILNTNAQSIAQKLFKQSMQVGYHLTVSDDKSAIEQGITFLLQTHRALIITGGLGPTSDDLTRYALANVTKQPLHFDTAVWNAICERIRLLGYKTIPESNRQQALFPEQATIIPNPNGTAYGCMLTYHDAIIFMLPGPPVECLPMIDETVIPQLKKLGFQKTSYFTQWLLFGVSEGKIAEELDALAKPFDCRTGYRIAFPYIEFKIYSNNQHDFNQLIPKVETVIAPYLLNNQNQTASSLLREKLQDIHFKLYISDVATGGLLENILRTPQTHAQLIFSSPKNEKNYFIEIEGLNEFWQAENVTFTHLTVRLSNKERKTEIKTQIPLRGRSQRIKEYAVEYISQQIYNFLIAIPDVTLS